jgi:putative PIN family toxin of toxin-antitoxin system
MTSRRYVFDTNVIVSALLINESTPAKAFRSALDAGAVLVSGSTIKELDNVLARLKFERYVTREERERFLGAFLERAELVEVTVAVQACRDPEDDKFLELAVSGSATAIVTGDPDLLALDPFENIRIVRPADLLNSLISEDSAPE